MGDSYGSGDELHAGKSAWQNLKSPDARDRRVCNPAPVEHRYRRCVQTEDILRRALAASVSGTCFVDPEGRILSANRAMLTM